MTLLFAFGLLLAAFYMGVANGLIPHKPGASRRGARVMIVAGVVAFAIWEFGQSTTAAMTAVTQVFAILFMVLVFLLGLGILLGAQVARLRTKSTTRTLAVCATMAVPAALCGLAAYQLERHREAEEAAKIAARKAFRSQTLSANFGAHSVTFPVSPGLTIRHFCKDQSRVCVTSWLAEGINQAPADDLVLVSMQFSSITSFAEEFTTWCASRSDIADTAWCERHRTRDFTLQLQGRTRAPWGQAQGAEPFEAPEQIKSLACWDHWKGRYCRATIDVAPGIEAHVPSHGLTPDDAGRHALETLPAINRLWQAMTQGE
ncbi:hypothetical protein FIU89_12855 [Roseovarius sp. THAF27]|uniref:hypothetical protein n=1 Tax=Roseovarius sp. THAF27 TaxID=2587850 RepID=UPI0012697FA4|nr:hypothetical protein [Roseovarius sp. THAF27]QFT81506.1 hypothetical protein FIU89_12855 [Roseovarius sp. THAF27]